MILGMALKCQTMSQGINQPALVDARKYIPMAAPSIVFFHEL